MAIAGTFATREQARDAVDRLLAVGVPADAVSAVTAHNKPVTLTETSTEQVNEMMWGAGIGATIGAIAGVAAAAVALPGIGAVLAVGPLVFGGALMGGVTGALAKLGFGEEHAERLTERLKAGRFLVIVHDERSTTNLAQIETALMNAGAEDVRVADRPT